MIDTQEFSCQFSSLVAKFDCGNSYLNQFLRSSDALNPGIGKTFVFYPRTKKLSSVTIILAAAR